VYIVSSVKFPRIKVDVIEQGVVLPAVPLTGSTILNLDSQNADIENADIENADIENADIENKELHNADIENADIENADIENADIENADIENADIENADIENADIENADIENADIENADIENADIENADIENGSVSDYSVELENGGNTATAYQVKATVNGDTSPYLFQLIGRRVYKTPTAIGCTPSEAGQNQILFNVNLTAADLQPGALPNPLDPSPKNAVVLVAPGEHIKLTLRVWDRDVLTGPGAPPNDGIQPFCPVLSTSPAGACQEITHEVIITAGSVSSNTGSNTPPVTTFPSSPTPVPFTLIVTNTNDSGPGSLRQAIITANAHTGFRDEITFNIPGAGVHTITPLSPLPQLTDAVTIDGTTQPGYAGSPVIELNGASAGAGVTGLTLGPGSGSFLGGCPPPPPPGGEGGGPQPCDPVFEPGTTIRALAINRFGGNGILVQSNGNTIAGNYIGTNPAGTIDLGNARNGIQIVDAAANTIGGTGGAPDRNVVSGNQGEGIRVDGANATGNMVRGNYIGTSASGMADLGNSASGVFLRKAPANSVIQNLISGNDGFAGVAICGGTDGVAGQCGGLPSPGTTTSNASGNVIQGNLIGTNALGTGALGNSQRGVSIDGAPNTLVGGPLGGDRNVISATAAGPGIVIANPGADNNLIRGNFVGTDINGTAPLGNNGIGVLIADGSGNVVSGKEEDRTAPNVIKHNAGAGIYLSATGQHEFRVNQIDANGGLGITGGEVLLNGPNLTGASLTGGAVTVVGNFSGPAGTYTIDLYKSGACDASGFGEGAQWFAAFTVNAVSIEGPTGFASFNITFPVSGVTAGQLVTAIATSGDQITTPGATGTTSQFSNCQMAVPPGFAFSTPSQGGNGHVYEYVPTPGTWTAANAAAPTRAFRGVAGHLATITNAFENGVIDTLRNNSLMRGWIGLTDQVTEGTYQWVTGEPFGFASWSAGEPNNGSVTGTNNEDFIEFFAGGGWNDTTNGELLNLGYVVEYDANPFQGGLTDAAADSGGGPDLISAEAINTGINLIVRVRFTSGTFSAANTLAQLSLDTDRNPATGHPGVNAGCVTDAGIIGAEYLVDIQNTTAKINHYNGTCNQFTLTSTIAATPTSNGYDVTIPLASLGGDDGVVNFKFTTSTQTAPGAYTGVQDTMSDPGLPPGNTVIGGS